MQGPAREKLLPSPTVRPASPGKCWPVPLSPLASAAPPIHYSDSALQPARQTHGLSEKPPAPTEVHIDNLRLIIERRTSFEIGSSFIPEIYTSKCSVFK